MNKFYPHRKLYFGEIRRTQQPPILADSPNTNTRCRYCQNEDTQRIINHIDLQPFVDFYIHRKFIAYSCHLCGGLGHWEIIDKL